MNSNVFTVSYRQIFLEYRYRLLAVLNGEYGGLFAVGITSFYNFIATRFSNIQQMVIIA